MDRHSSRVKHCMDKNELQGNVQKVNRELTNVSANVYLEGCTPCYRLLGKLTEGQKTVRFSKHLCEVRIVFIPRELPRVLNT